MVVTKEEKERQMRMTQERYNELLAQNILTQRELDQIEIEKRVPYSERVETRNIHDDDGEREDYSDIGDKEWIFKGPKGDALVLLEFPDKSSAIEFVKAYMGRI